jgi:uncharacterized membrane protein
MPAPLALLRGTILLALVGSAVSLADDGFAGRPFCGFESGCDAVTRTVYGRPFGVPLSAIGLVGFGVLFVLTLFPTARSFSFVAPLAVLAGVIGACLIAVQAIVLTRFCPVCLFCDGAAIGAAVLALHGRVWRRTGEGPSGLGRSAWAAGAAVAVAAPLLVMLVVEQSEPPIPDEVKAHWVEGAVTLVEVTDFDCPYCRQAEPAIAAFRQKHPEVRFVRLVAPMPAHANARPAGRAFLAARAQGRGEEMAVLLLAADSRTPDQSRQFAAQLGMDLSKYDRMVSDRATDAEMDATVAWAKAAGTGLPLVWVQDKRVRGVPTAAALGAALLRVRSN